MAKYRFILSAGLQTHIAIPIWKSDMNKEYAFESRQMFRRASLSDALVFLADDYDWIMSQSIETKIGVTLQADWNEDGTFVDYWRGSFHQTDCTINIDDHKVKVKPNVEDRYNKILAGLDKEYDLIKLKPAIQPVTMWRRPLLQIYTLNESKVNCFLAGMFWEQEVTDSGYTDGQLRGDMHFGKCGEFIQIAFSGTVPTGLTDGFYGTWEHGRSEGEWPDFSNDADVYFMTYFQYITVWPDSRYYANGLRIYSINDPSTVLWEFKQGQSYEVIGNFLDIPTTFTMTSQRTGVADLSASWSGTNIYGRWLLAKEFNDAYQIPSTDLVQNNRNYKYCYPYVASGIIRMTNRSSVNPTEWGLRPDGTYYMKPLLSIDEQQGVDAQYPIGRSGWEAASMWLQWTSSETYMDENYRVETPLRDAYTLEAVINALLAVIDPTITFAATSAYSEFLYGSNPLMAGFGRLVMTPKSNVLVAEYTQPAQKAMVELGDVFNMLQKALGCYWFIDDNNRLRIEHVSFFKNGMSYSGSPAIGVDVTEMFNSRNGHSWVLGTGEYSFDKMQMPERYEYEWMDETTAPFKGEAIEVRSTFVQEGEVEEVNVANFNSDVDYMMLNPSDVSEDGFALLCCQVSQGVYSLTFQGVQVDSETHVTLQNPQLAMMVLQPAFLISDMPAWNITVNGANTTARGIQRQKKQQIKVPIGNDDGNMNQLVRTSIGNGEVERVAISLTSRMAKFNLRYDTAQQ